MKVFNKDYRSIWAKYDEKKIFIINQTLLPFQFEIKELTSVNDVYTAIKNLEVRGAPAIGIAAAFGMWLSFYRNNANKEKILNDYNYLISCRPTAVNLQIGATYVLNKIINSKDEKEIFLEANYFAEREIIACKSIGLNGLSIIKKLYEKKQSTINILTHCNAGWLACGDYGTALAPIFEANRNNIPVHVWVDETRPLNQGSRLTAWELHHESIPYHIISDNTGGLLMMKNKVDIVLVGADRIAKNGDVANKIGTFLKALAANEYKIPFYVAAPTSTFDKNISTGNDIIIEERNQNELKKIFALTDDKKIKEFSIIPDEFVTCNYAFDITPAKFITGYITEQGIFDNINDIL
jgi:methylthioribose-1-phosphate isomerase